MKVDIFLNEGEEYPQLISVWRLDQKTGRADLTTRRNYVDDRNGCDQWRKTDDENIRLNAENTDLRQQLADVTESMGRVEERCAKLRKLADGLRYCANEAYGMCARAPVGGERPFTCCPLYDFNSKEYGCEKLMRELGVEAE